MPLYFLHIRDGVHLIEDPDGSDLPNVEAAYSEAVANARDILASKVRAGEVVDGQVIEITDENGTVKATLLMRDVLRLD